MAILQILIRINAKIQPTQQMALSSYSNNNNNTNTNSLNSLNSSRYTSLHHNLLETVKILIKHSLINLYNLNWE